jgi:hypothetical protein
MGAIDGSRRANFNEPVKAARLGMASKYEGRNRLTFDGIR